MTQHDFIRVLTEELQDYMPIEEVRKNAVFYKEYIEGERASGRSEESIFAELGDPRLIARTILDAGGYSDSFQGETYRNPYEEQTKTYSSSSGSYSDRYADQEETVYREDVQGENPFHTHVFRLDRWYHRLAFFAIIALVIFCVVSVLSGIVALLFRLAVPILLVVLVLGVVRYILNG